MWFKKEEKLLDFWIWIKKEIGKQTSFRQRTAHVNIYLLHTV